MTLHKAVKPRDRRYELIYDSTDRLGAMTAHDAHGQRWVSTRHRRWISRQWDCGHIGEPITTRSTDYLGNPRTSNYIHRGHDRFWQRMTKRRGVDTPERLCEMLATLSPWDPQATTELPGLRSA